MKVRTIAALLFALFCFTFLAQAQTSFTIAGSVHGSSGNRIARAQVAVLSPSDGITMQSSTDSQGAFRVDVPKPATYEVQITATGFKKLSASAVVNPSSPSVHLDLTMEPEPQADGKEASQSTSSGSALRQTPTSTCGDQQPSLISD